MERDLDGVLLSSKDNITTLTFNDPNALNAISLQTLKALSNALDIIEDPELNTRCLIITGAGRGFCAGANILSGGDGDNGGKPDPNKKVDAGAALESHYHPILRRLRNLPCPIVTSVNGAAAGVGMSFALMGDMIIAGKSAYFLQAFRRIGLVPDGGATWLLPRLVGMARARELALMGEKLPAEKALEWGLINRVVEDSQLIEETQKIAQSLAEGPMSIGLIRSLMTESIDNSYEEQLNMERQLQRKAGRSTDFTEGVMAFAQKRPAKFSGK
jgi:2-(1,2-epoxy-1,2-dihydrophenyl)acetyl-CoA isomerase